MQFWLKTTVLTGEEGERLMAPLVTTSPSPVCGLWLLVTLLIQMWSPFTQMGSCSFARETKLWESTCLFPVFCLYVISRWKPADVAGSASIKGWNPAVGFSYVFNERASHKLWCFSSAFFFFPLWGALWSVRFLQRNRSSRKFYLYLSIYMHMSLLSISSVSV